MRSSMLVWLLCASASLSACELDDACDPGYREDHGACIPLVQRSDAGGDADADGGTADGGASGSYSGDDSDFGRPCQTMQDCGGKAPVCAAPMLPRCTAINCLQHESECPASWTCLDISMVSTSPVVKSICVQL